MIRLLLQTSIHSFLLIFILFTSSNGQNSSQPKLVKTQGSNEYQTVVCGLQDKVGHLWFGTSAEGLYRYDGKSFTQFTVKDGLLSNTILSIVEDKDGKIWLGTVNGVCYYNGKTFNAVSIPLSNIFFLPSVSLNTNPSAKNEVWSMMQDRSGKIWFGTREGVYWFDGKSVHRLLDDTSIINKEGLHLNMVFSILEDKEGVIWFGSGMPPGMEGLCRYDGKSITSFKPHGNGWIRSILEEKDGNLLLDTRSYGVCRYDGKTLTNITEQAGINNQSVWTMMKDKSGTLWMGTELGSGQLGEGGGLWRYDGKSFTKFTTKDGLCHNGVCCIVEDRAGNIWIGTRNTGLSRFDGKVFTNFTE